MKLPELSWEVLMYTQPRYFTFTSISVFDRRLVKLADSVFLPVVMKQKIFPDSIRFQWKTEKQKNWLVQQNQQARNFFQKFLRNKATQSYCNQKYFISNWQTLYFISLGAKQYYFLIKSTSISRIERSSSKKRI